MKPLSPELKKKFTDICGLSERQMTQLKTYGGLIEQWQKAINLVSPKTIDDLWERHLLDSAQLLPLIKNMPSFSVKTKLVDLGSGGGLPGIVLAITMDNPITMIESDKRKCIFLKEVIRTLGLKNCTIINQRIEEKHDIKADIVTARALAPLNQLIKWAKPLLNDNGHFVFMKGEDVEKEINAVDKNTLQNRVLVQSITEPSAHVFMAQAA